MKKFLFLSFIGIFFISCGGGKSTVAEKKNYLHRANISSKPLHRVNPHGNNKPVKKAREKVEELDKVLEPSFEIKQEIIDYAKTFQGTRYKFGGTTSAGMDCSGLVCKAFEKENINLPRISRDIATKGKPVSVKEIEKGDLVFFKTSGKNVISHVGLVVEADNGTVKFIHSTTQAGVIISSLDEAYWKRTFAEVRRII